MNPALIPLINLCKPDARKKSECVKKVPFFVTFSLHSVPASKSFEEWREIRNLRLQSRDPLIHTSPPKNLAQYILFYQRFSGLGNDISQTIQTFSLRLTIVVNLHSGHLTGWSLTRLIESGSRPVIRFHSIKKGALSLLETRIQSISPVAVPAKNIVITPRPKNMLVCAWALFWDLRGERDSSL